MNAVLEKPARKARVPKAGPAPAVQAPKISAEQAMFEEAGDFLIDASETDEAHGPRAESDRLLRIAAMIAYDASKGRLSNTTAENTAYDAVACINAARLVPGDAESVERTALINSAAKRLAVIVGGSADEFIFTDVPRPADPQKKSSASASATVPAVEGKQFTKDKLKELHWQAFGCMTNAYSVLVHYAEHAEDSAIYAARDLLESYLSKAEPKAGDDAEIQVEMTDMYTDLTKIFALVFALATSNGDNVMHGIAELLSCAQRIADGDKGVLDA